MQDNYFRFSQPHLQWLLFVETDFFYDKLFQIDFRPQCSTINIFLLTSSVMILSSKWKDVCEKKIKIHQWWIISEIFNFQNASNFPINYCYKNIISDWMVKWLQIGNICNHNKVITFLNYFITRYVLVFQLKPNGDNISW